MIYKISELCEITSSKRIFANEYTKNGIPFYRGKEIIELAEGKSISTDLYISQEKFNEIKSKYDTPKYGDILLTAVGTLGIPYFVTNTNFYFKDGNLMWFKNFNNFCISKFFYYYLQSSHFKNIVLTKAIGSTQKAITIDTIKNTKINIPELVNQQHIVDTIGSIDNKIEHNEKLISKIEEFLLLKFNKLEKTVGVVFSDVFRCFNGGTFKSSDYVDLSQYKLITIKNIDNTGFNTSNATYIPKMNKYEKYKLSIGDILLTMTGAYLGRLGIVDEDNCYLNQRVLKISGMSKSFLYCFLKYNQNEIFSLGKGSAQPNLSITDLNIFPVNYSHNTIKSFCFNDKYIDYIINLKQEIK